MEPIDAMYVIFNSRENAFTHQQMQRITLNVNLTDKSYAIKELVVRWMLLKKDDIPFCSLIWTMV